MKILILGGTQFLGRQLVDCAMAGGHNVTLFNRAKSNPNLFPSVETIVGDRNRDLSLLRGRTWDVVIDTCGYFPSQLRKSATELKDSVDHYIYISSMSVYESPQIGGDESGLTYQLSPGIDPEIPTDATYGLRKKLCEDEVEFIMPGRVTHVRAGLIVGPYDQTWRYPYWVNRVKLGGDICAPESPSFQIRYVDVKDLSEWILKSVARQTTGIFNALGPYNGYTFGSFLDECVELINPGCRLVWMDKSFLASEGVKPWSDLPMWLDSEDSNLHLLSAQKGIDAGLRFSSPKETILRTLKWIEAGKNLPTGDGLDSKKEKELLIKWQRLKDQKITSSLKC